jgi:alpha-1,6-mannosyltransferase
MGRLGPVNDSAAMAANILEVWNGDRKRMGEAARQHALQFSWERSMEALFGRVYPNAFAQRARRLSEQAAAGQRSLAGAP